MSHVLREERENCCDDIAVKHLKSKKKYIHALISFKESALYGSSYTTAFPGGKNQLLKRVSRIVHNKNNTLDRTGKLFFLVSFLLLALLSIVATNWETNITTVKEETRVLVPVSVTYSSIVNIKGIVSANKPDGKRKKEVATYSGHLVNTDKANTSLMSKSKKDVIQISLKTDITEHLVTSSGAEQTKEITNHQSYYQNATLYMQQAEKDKEQAKKDREQAELDRIQAQKDRAQAVKDVTQAALDRIQAEKDRQQAEKDRQQAEKDRQNIEIKRQIFPGS